MTVYLTNDNDIMVDGLSLDANGSFINDARITATLYDSSGNALANGTITLAYVTGSNGNYRGTIPSTGGSAVAFTAGAQYSAVVKAGNYGWAETCFFTSQTRNA